jgi:hypothetical protein
MRALLVEDDHMIGEAVANALKDASYAVDWVGCRTGSTSICRRTVSRAVSSWRRRVRHRAVPVGGDRAVLTQTVRACRGNASSQFTPPVAARPVLETNVRSGLCVTEDHHAALSQVHLHKDSAAGDRI